MVGRSACAELLSGLNTLTHVGVTGNLSDARAPGSIPRRSGETAEVAFEALVARHGPMVLDVCGNFWATPTTPRMPSRPRSSSWHPGRDRSDGGMPWPVGS